VPDTARTGATKAGVKIFSLITGYYQYSKQYLCLKWLWENWTATEELGEN